MGQLTKVKIGLSMIFKYIYDGKLLKIDKEGGDCLRSFGADKFLVGSCLQQFWQVNSLLQTLNSLEVGMHKPIMDSAH